MLGRDKLDSTLLTCDQGNFNQITARSRNRTLVTVVRDTRHQHPINGVVFSFGSSDAFSLVREFSLSEMDFKYMRSIVQTRKERPEQGLDVRVDKMRIRDLFTAVCSTKVLLALAID